MSRVPQGSVPETSPYCYSPEAVTVSPHVLILSPSFSVYKKSQHDMVTPTPSHEAGTLRFFSTQDTQTHVSILHPSSPAPIHSPTTAPNPSVAAALNCLVVGRWKWDRMMVVGHLRWVVDYSRGRHEFGCCLSIHVKPHQIPPAPAPAPPTSLALSLY